MSPSLALCALLATASPEDPLAAAHAAQERTHVVSALKVDSAIESMNQNTVQVFGKRRELKCPGGGQVTESSCNPCTFKSSEWAERPADQWIVDVSWSNSEEGEHAAAMLQIDHFKKYFDLEPRGGAEKEGRRFALYELKGPRVAPAEDLTVTSLKLLADGKESMLALIPAGSREVVIEAKALRRSGSEVAEVAQAVARFEAACAEVVVAGPMAARVSLKGGVERCELKATSGKASATIIVRRELELFITCEGQRADSLVLKGANVIELAFAYEPAAKPVKIVPEWTVENGKLEVSGGGSKITLRLEPKTTEAKVTLLDKESGATATVAIKR